MNDRSQLMDGMPARRSTHQLKNRSSLDQGYFPQKRAKPWGHVASINAAHDSAGQGEGGILSNAPTAYPTRALSVPIKAISRPLRPGWPTVTLAL